MKGRLVHLTSLFEAAQMGRHEGLLDHVFRTGQACGVSGALNIIIDRLRDPAKVSQHAAFGEFSDEMHEHILADAKKIGLTVELVDAKGELLDE